MRRAIKRKFKKKYQENYHKIKGKFYFSLLEKLYYSLFLTDIEFTKKTFKSKFGYDINLENPKTFNEKLHWLKLYRHTELHTYCADKLKVRDYVKDIIGAEYLIPLIFKTTKIQDIVADNFPKDTPFVIKTNHDSGSVVLIKDNKNIQWNNIKSLFEKSLKVNYYFFWREKQYKNISPIIFAEKMLQQNNGDVPYDYKFHCINNKISFIQVDLNRETNHTRTLYDSEWNLLPFSYGVKQEKEITAPASLSKMISLAKKLSTDFTYVRVDFYEVDGKIYFGELTFVPGAGYESFSPSDWDYKLGKNFTL